MSDSTDEKPETEKAEKGDQPDPVKKEEPEAAGPAEAAPLPAPEAEASESERASEGERAFFAGGDAEPAPASEEEVDPELLKLPRRRRRRHPLISLAVIGLSLYLMWFVRQDLFFFFQGGTPTEAGDAASALREGKLRAGSFVSLTGAPDRKHAIVLESKLGGGYESFYRLLGTQNRIFVQQHRATRGADAVLASSLTGHLVRFDTLPYRQGLRDYFAKAQTIAHDLDLAEVERAKRTSATRLKDRTGAEVKVTAGTTVWVNVAYPNEWLIQASKRSYAKLEETRKLVADLGLPTAVDDEESAAFFRYVVHAEPDQVALLLARFRDPSLHANVVRRQVSYSARWDQVSVSGRTLELNAADPSFPSSYRVDKSATPPRLAAFKELPAKIPAEGILYITIASPLEIAPDALVLLVGRRPAENWYYLALYVLLLAFIVINGWTLSQRLRERRARPQSGS